MHSLAYFLLCCVIVIQGSCKQGQQIQSISQRHVLFLCSVTSGSRASSRDVLGEKVPSTLFVAGGSIWLFFFRLLVWVLFSSTWFVCRSVFCFCSSRLTVWVLFGSACLVCWWWFCLVPPSCLSVWFLFGSARLLLWVFLLSEVEGHACLKALAWTNPKCD